VAGSRRGAEPEPTHPPSASHRQADTARAVQAKIASGKPKGRPVNWEDTIVEAAATDTGMRRTNNQDNLAIVRAANPTAWRQRGHLFLVADGMGAHAVGELASKLACDNIPHNYNKAKDLSAVDALVKAYREVGAIIHGKATANRDFQGMGTTCSTLILLPQGALIAHVGDSRVYRVRDERIDQLSFDHSLVWELVRRNHLSPEQAQKAVPRNVITRSLGPDPTVEVDIEGPLPVEQRDVYVLCSDGLSGPVGDGEIGAIANNFHPDDATRYLIHLANIRGGMDNITVVVVRIGPWTDPRGAASAAEILATKSKKTDGKGFRLASLFPALARKPAPPTVEEHIYQSSDCPVDEEMLQRLTDTVRKARAIAIEQGWGVDWSILANLQRESEAARAEGDLRASLRCLCEGVVLLGLAGRIFRKEQGSNGPA
jgi:protein phosphatase